MAFDFAAKTARTFKTFQKASFVATPHAGHYLHPSYMHSQFQNPDWPRSDKRGDHRIARRGRDFWGELSAVFPGVGWQVVEPTVGNYDFSMIRAWLQWLAEQQMFYGINWVTKNFNAKDGDTIPADLVDVGGQARSGQFASFNAAVWRTDVETAMKNCMTRFAEEFGDHPWFVGLEFTETAGVDGVPIRYINVSPWYEAVPGATNTYTKRGFAEAWGRLYEHFGALRPNLIAFGGTNKFEGGKADNLVAFKQCFDQITLRPNMLFGGPDILITGPDEHSGYLMEYGYDLYNDPTLEFSLALKKCSMQNTSQIVNLNIGKPINSLWRWGVRRLHLACVQWNWHDGEGPVTLAQGTGTYEHTWVETRAMIAGSTPINWQDAQYDAFENI